MNLQNHNINIELTKDITHGSKLLISSAIYGRKGKLQYRHKNPLQKLTEIENKLMLNVMVKQQVVQTSLFSERITNLETKKITSFYIRYLSVKTNYKRNFKSREYLNKKKIQKNSLSMSVKSFAYNFFNSQINGTNKKIIFYAYIENENIGSLHFAKLFDCITIRKIKTLLFSRISPKLSSNVFPIHENEKKIIIDHLEKKYFLHTLFTTDNLFKDNNYYIHKKNGEITAGVKACPIQWELMKVPGFLGFIMQHVLPYLPYTSRLFKPKDFNFLAFEGIWFKDGCEQDLITLLESLCHINNYNLGMMWFDKECPVGNEILTTKKLGILNKIKENIDIDIVFNSLNISDEEKLVYKNNPAYVSAYDLT